MVRAAEAVLRQARARQRRRRWLVVLTGALAVIAVAFVAGGDWGASKLASLAGGSAPSGAASANAADAALGEYVVIQPGGGGRVSVSGPGAVPASISVTNAGTGISTIRRLVPVSSTSYPWVVVGNTVVVVDDTQTMTPDLSRPEIGTAYAFKPGGTTPPVALGPASGAVSAADGGVWLVTDSVTTLQQIQGQARAATCTIREVSLVGAALSPTYPLPCSLTVLEGTPNGLLTEAYAAGSVSVQIWNPATQAVVRSLSGLASSILSEGSTTTTPLANARFGIEVGEHNFGPCGPSQCSLSVIDLASGTTHPLPLPAGDNLWTPISIAPGQSDRLALVGFSPSGFEQYNNSLEAAEHRTGFPPDISFPATLLVSDVATGATLSERPVTIDFGEPLVWSPDAGYVFVIGDATHVSAYPARSSSSPGRKLVLAQALSMLVVQR